MAGYTQYNKAAHDPTGAGIQWDFVCFTADTGNYKLLCSTGSILRGEGLLLCGVEMYDPHSTVPGPPAS